MRSARFSPSKRIGKLIRGLRETGKKIWFHTDAVQAVGKITVDVEETGCDLLSISGHKIYARKVSVHFTCGAEFVCTNKISADIKERERRGGTENVPFIAAFGKACELAKNKLSENAENLQILRNRFESEVGEKISHLVFNGNREKRLPHISNLSFRLLKAKVC